MDHYRYFLFFLEHQRPQGTRAGGRDVLSPGQVRPGQVRPGPARPCPGAGRLARRYRWTPGASLSTMTRRGLALAPSRI